MKQQKDLWNLLCEQIESECLREEIKCIFAIASVLISALWVNGILLVDYIKEHNKNKKES